MTTKENPKQNLGYINDCKIKGQSLSYKALGSKVDLAVTRPLISFCTPCCVKKPIEEISSCEEGDWKKGGDKGVSGFTGIYSLCVCVFGFNVAFNNFSVISRRCLVATGSSMLTFIVLPHWSIMSQTLDMIPHPVTLSWHWVDQF